MDPLESSHVGFREKWGAESLSPISLSVSRFEAPRLFGQMEKTVRSFS